jgi:muconolactone delta-isomerase
MAGKKTAHEDEMQFLTISRRVSQDCTEADLTVLAEDEFERGRTLYLQNFIRQIWHRADTLGACLLVEAESEEEVRKTLSTLPFFQAGILEILVIPLKPYAGFGPRKRHEDIEKEQNGDQRTKVEA